MDSTIIPAVAAACGSLVGAAATIATTWLTQRTQRAHAEREEKLRNRETLSGELAWRRLDPPRRAEEG